MAKKPTKKELAARAAQLKDPDYTPPMSEAIPLGFQHVCAMLVGNIAVPFIIGGALGLEIGDKNSWCRQPC